MIDIVQVVISAAVAVGAVVATIRITSHRVDRLEIEQKNSEQRCMHLVQQASTEAMKSMERMAERFTDAMNQQIQMMAEFRASFNRVHERIDSLQTEMREFQKDMASNYVTADTCERVHQRR
jgi:predicted translin family RNA/ssDNA-binding protein